MAVVPFDHQDRGAHLFGKCVNVHTCMDQGHGGVGVPQGIQRAVLLGPAIHQQPRICEQHRKRRGDDIWRRIGIR